jgi:hypothetical protein
MCCMQVPACNCAKLPYTHARAGIAEDVNKRLVKSAAMACGDRRRTSPHFISSEFWYGGASESAAKAQGNSTEVEAGDRRAGAGSVGW